MKLQTDSQTQSFQEMIQKSALDSRNNSSPGDENKL